MSVPSFNDLVLPAGSWKDVEPFPRSHTKHSFISGRRDSAAIRVRYFQDPGTKVVRARAWFGPESEGPPGHAHGGSQAALLDEGMGAAAWLGGYSVLAAKLEINFRRPLPIGTLLTVYTEIEKAAGKKVYVRGRLEADDGRVFSESAGLFVVIDTDALLEKAGLKKKPV